MTVTKGWIFHCKSQISSRPLNDIYFISASAKLNICTLHSLSLDYSPHELAIHIQANEDSTLWGTSNRYTSHVYLCMYVNFIAPLHLIIIHYQDVLLVTFTVS